MEQTFEAKAKKDESPMTGMPEAARGDYRQSARGVLEHRIKREERKLEGLRALLRLLDAATDDDDEALWTLFVGLD